MNPHEMFKGLSDPTRLRIAMLLLDGELCVCDLMAILRAPQSTVSRHMSRLKTAGLVTDHRDGKWVHYRFATSRTVRDLTRLLRRHLIDQKLYADDRARLKKHRSADKCA